MIADTTPDVTHKEQLSVCVKIVDEVGDCSEHLLSCQRASGTSAVPLYNTIATALESRGVTCEKLVAQTYDGASHMNGYTHTLNQVLDDSASVVINVSSLFSNYQKLYLLFSKSQKVQELFESAQKNAQLQVFSIKRLNTVRWSAREFCLKISLSASNSERIVFFLEKPLR